MGWDIGAAQQGGWDVGAAQSAGTAGGSFTETIALAVDADQTESALLDAHGGVSLVADAALTEAATLDMVVTLALAVDADYGTEGELGGSTYTETVGLAAEASLDAASQLDAIGQISLVADGSMTQAATLDAFAQLVLQAEGVFQLSSIADLTAVLGLTVDAGQSTTLDAIETLSLQAAAGLTPSLVLVSAQEQGKYRLILRGAAGFGVDPTVQFTQATSVLPITGLPTAVPLHLAVPYFTRTRVEYALGGTAVVDVDYLIEPSVVMFDAGETDAEVQITPLAGSEGKTIEVTLNPPFHSGRINTLTFTDDFQFEVPNNQDNGQPTDWLFGCDATAGGNSLEMELDFGVTKPDGELGAHILKISPIANLHGCCRKSYYPWQAGGYNSPGYIQEYQEIDLYVRERDASHFQIQIYDRTIQHTHGVTFQWIAGVPTIHSTVWGGVGTVLTDDPRAEPIVSNGWYRCRTAFSGTLGVDVGHTRQVFFRPTSPHMGSASSNIGVGTYFADAQCAHAADQPYQKIPTVLTCDANRVHTAMIVPI